MSAYELIHDDVLKWAKEYTGPKYHALLADAPYHLTEIVKRFGGVNSAPAKAGKDGSFARLSKGFMGASWDGGAEIAFQPSTWQAIGEHLHGGAFFMVFAGTRGYHRMATAIEDAGFIIHPAIGWSFGSGFPKATRVDDQIDSAAGKVQAKIGEKQHQPKFAAADFAYREKDNGFNSKDRATFDVLAPATDLAAAWSGHRYGLQAIKPAFEFICVAQKPYEQVSCESIRAATGWDHWCTTSELDNDTRTRYAAKWGIELPLEGVVYQIARKALHAGVQSDIEYWCDDSLLHTVNVKPFRAWATDNSVACMLVTRGAGALNIDAGRIGTKDHLGGGTYGGILGNGKPAADEGNALGRWPANLILSHNPTCERIGIRQIRGTKGNADYTTTGVQGVTSIVTNVKTGRHHADSDGLETVDEWRCDEGCAVARLGAQSGETGISSGAAAFKPNQIYNKDNRPLDDMRSLGIGDTGTAARYFFNSDYMYERLEAADPVIYQAKASTAERDAGLDELPTITVDDGRQKPIDNPHLRGETGRKNPHPTIKSADLCKHLASLLLPPDMYAGERRLLVPFAGVGSEILGGLLAGFDFVTGIELEEKHVKVGNIRLAKWQEVAERMRTSEPDVIVKALTKASKAVDTGQRSLFDLDEAA